MKTVLSLLITLILNRASALNTVPALWQSDDASWRWQAGVLWHNDTAFNGAVTRQQLSEREISFYVNGKLHGEQRRYDENGRLLSLRSYHDGYKTDTHRGWWPNGQLKFEYQFNADQHDGPAYSWHQNGQLASAFHYENGHESGMQQLWFENGQLRAQYQMLDGRRFGWMGSKLCQ